MDSNPPLTQGPIHVRTREYIDRKVVEMEERLANRIAIRDMNAAGRIGRLETKFFAGLAELIYKIKEIESQCENLGGYMDSLKKASARAALTAAEPCSPIKVDAHTESEIRQLILDNGHKIKWRKSFTSRHFADDLEEHVELRPGDKCKAADGRDWTAWQAHVANTLYSWRHGSVRSPKFYGECPFELIYKKDYKVKEGWEWPNQSA